jgi:putative transcriptional regulator
MRGKPATRIRRGLEEAVGVAAGDADRRRYRVHIPAAIDAKAIRKKLRLTQAAFAARFGFSLDTLRHWEQGRRVPEGPARAYLRVIARDPKAVERAFKAA